MEPILICDGKYKLKHPSEIKEWTDNITSWPEVTYGNIYNYLIKAPGYDHEQLEAYKSLEAYNNFMSGHVETVFFTQITSKSPYCYLKAKVRRSQKVTRAPRQPWILVRRDSGAIITAQCDCEAGLGEVCSHVAAVLFKVECAVRMGLLQKAPTERGCEWNNNFSKKVSPAAINDIQFIKHKYGKKSRERRYRQPLQPVPPSEAAIKELHALLPEAVYFTTCDKVDAESTDTASEGEDDTDGLPALLTSITTAESFGRYHITKAQAEQLATSTSRQAESPLWKAHRKGRITASLVHKIITRKSTTPPNVLVSEVMGESSFDGMRVEATRWGLIHEAEAIQLYKSDTSHMNMKLHRPGLIVDHELPFFGATPDGLFTCDCHGNGVLEVKCPFKYRDEYPENLAGSDNFILDVNMNIVTSHKYFSQVQFQMQLCHATVCDLVIWTKHGLLQIQVAHDATYCSTMLQKATAFFTEAVLPALTSQSQPPSVSSAQTPSVSSAQTPSVSSVSSAKEPAKNHNSVDKDTVLYCLCREPEHGNMIACDNDSCAIEWFHYNCVDITTPPRGRWFCPDCNDC